MAPTNPVRAWLLFCAPSVEPNNLPSAMNTASKNVQTGRAVLGDSAHAGLTVSLPVSPKPKLPEQQPPDMPVKVVLAYDDDTALHAAMGVYRGVVRRLTADFEFRDSWLSFSSFAEPTLLEQAVHVASVADIIFCCPSNRYVLPRPVQEWIRLWLVQRTQSDGALVVLLPAIEGKPAYQTTVEADLRETAHANSLAFFASEYPPHGLRPLASLAATSPTTLGEDLDAIHVPQGRPDVSHWGINE